MALRHQSTSAAAVASVSEAANISEWHTGGVGAVMAHVRISVLHGPNTLLNPAQPTCTTLSIASPLRASCSRQQLDDNRPAMIAVPLRCVQATAGAPSPPPVALVEQQSAALDVSLVGVPLAGVAAISFAGNPAASTAATISSTLLCPAACSVATPSSSETWCVCTDGIEPAPRR